MEKPLVDIILPVLNAEKTIEQSINSILAQSETRWHLILVDNGSSDRCIELYNGFKDRRITVVHEPRRGISFALNHGIKLATAPLVARMDADDIALPRRLESQIEYLNEHRDVGVVAGLVECHGSELNQGIQLFVDWNNTLISHQDMLEARFIDVPLIHPSVMLRRNLFAKFGDYSTENVPEDYELWLRLFEKGVKFGKVPECSLHWRDHQERLTRKHQNYSQKAFEQVRVFYLCNLLRGLAPRKKKLMIWGAGKHGRNLFKALKERSVDIQGFIDVAPNKINRPILGKPCVDYQTLTFAEHQLILVAVRKRGARQEIIDFLTRRGGLQNEDFICVY